VKEMFDSFKNKEVEGLEKSLEKLGSTINELNRVNDNLQNKIIDLENKLEEFNQKNRNVSHEVDFKKMQAFSIERDYQNNEWRTIIGYFISAEPTNPKEWHLYCSIEVHESLVRKFREYMKE
jgi:flagellar biosynthesis GTPase FlhF